MRDVSIAPTLALILDKKVEFDMMNSVVEALKQDMNYLQKLQKIGLTKKQAKVYLACLTLGSATAQDISKKTKLKRPTVYSVLESLQGRRLVKIVMKNKRYYYFGEDLNSLKSEFDLRYDTFQELIPALQKITSTFSVPSKFRQFEGKEGLQQAVWETSESKGAIMYDWTNYKIIDYLGPQFVKDYIVNRRKNRVVIQELTDENDISKDFHNRDIEELRRMKFFNGPHADANISICLYGKRNIMFIDPVSENAYRFENNNLFLLMKSAFCLNWSSVNEKMFA